MLTRQLFCVFVLSASLTACGGGGNEPTTPPPQPVIQDNDNDGIADAQDTDDDNDGVLDTDDAFPFDETESVDTDGDGIGNNADDDDDGDGVLDVDDAFPLDVSESLDTDGDGIGNNADNDDDGDGFLDDDDAFPLDASEWLDTDGDGIGNNADEDDDGDGVPDTEDAFPLDPNESADTDNDGVGDNADFYPTDGSCFKQQNGNGEQCYLTYLKQNINSVKNFTLVDQIVFFDGSTNQLLLVDSDSSDFLDPIQLDPSVDVTALIYSTTEQGFYIGTTQGITFLSSTTGVSTEFFATSYSVRELAFLGAFVGVLEEDNSFRIIDKNGVDIDGRAVSGSNLGMNWDSLTNTVFFYEQNSNTQPSITTAVIDIQTGIILERYFERTSTTNSRDLSLIIPPGESNIVFYAGTAFRKSNLNEVAIETLSPALHSWWQETGLLTLNYNAGDTELTWFDNNLTELQTVTIDGGPLGLAQNDSQAIVLTETLSQLNLTVYPFLEDIDGDNVSNQDDAFPSDPAASLDTDEDNYPDSWNEGKSEGDSNSGLSLDAFPEAFDCWLDTHANANGTCDFSATVPSFAPSSVMSGPDDLAFIHNADNGRIYVYDAATQTFLPSLSFTQRQDFVISRPQQIVYNVAHKSFYYHFSNQTLFAKRYSDGVLSESVEFSSYSEEEFNIHQVVPVGNFLLLQSQNTYTTQILIDENGIQTDILTGYRFSNSFAWNETNDTLYHFRDGISPNDLLYIQIDQTSGTFGNAGDSPYHGSYSIYGPIIVSNDGQKIVLGSGDIYDANDLTWQGSYGRIDNAFPMEDDSLVLINYAGATAQLVRRDNRNRTLETRIVDSDRIDVIRTENEQVLVYSVDGSLVVESFVANNDSDGDGVDNLDDAFPLDVAASLDSDNDGYPDSWNSGYTEMDSTTGLTLDAFPADSACWASEHANENGTCDYAATMPDFTPTTTLSDSSGNVFLFNSDDATVYRWSTQTNSFLNPIRVGQNDGFVQLSPSRLTYSNAHQRLYFGYGNGDITFVDLEGSIVEQPFYRLPQSVGGLAAVGEFVLAQDSSGAWNTHYIIDENGSLTDSEEWNYYSPEYVWNPINSRVYFFRNGTSPNDLHYEEIDQVSGEITEEGESPYHGDYRIFGPIVISQDGSRVILGSGDIYDATDLTWLGSVGEFDQAAVLANGELLLVNQNGSAIDVVRIDASNRVLEEYSLDADFVRVVSDGQNHTIITMNNGELTFTPYLPNNDTDNDGVDNSLDAFPTDPAASVDSDNDGYPDSWNDGYSADDSTTGLVLDTFPDDSACWLDDHATPTGSCDYAATMPDFTPSKMVFDESGNIYLLNAEDSKVYRWSAQEEAYSNPLQAGQGRGTELIAPIQMAYSPMHQRLYFGYSDGEITYIDLTSASTQETFYRLPRSVGGLVATGNFVLAQDASGAWNTHYVIAQHGTLTDSVEWNRYSRQYAWNQVNNRVYFFRDGTSPNDLHYEVIHQNTGQITEEGETPYHSSANIRLPIRIINNGENVLLGSGFIYDANTLMITTDIGFNVVDAASFEDVFVVVTEGNSEHTLRIYRNDTMALQYSISLDSPIYAVIPWGEQVVLISEASGERTFSFINLGDNDGDGLPAWWESAYGLSDDIASDATSDDDGDRLTNLQEFELNSDPTMEDTDADGLSDGDEFYDYETNLLISDTDSDGLSDGEEVLTYGTLPNEVDTDGDSFSDGDEVLLYDTDPLDGQSVPEAISEFRESFEDLSISNLFSTSPESDADWLISDFEPQEGLQVARSGGISDGQSSVLVFSGLFATGTLTFDAKVSSESCCDMLRVYVNDQVVMTVSNGDWNTYSIDITQGENTIMWEYRKDGSVSSGEDSAFIDNIVFSQ